LAKITKNTIKIKENEENIKKKQALFVPFDLIKKNNHSSINNTQNNTNVTCPSFLVPTHITSIMGIFIKKINK